MINVVKSRRQCLQHIIKRLPGGFCFLLLPALHLFSYCRSCRAAKPAFLLQLDLQTPSLQAQASACQLKEYSILGPSQILTVLTCSSTLTTVPFTTVPNVTASIHTLHNVILGLVSTVLPAHRSVSITLSFNHGTCTRLSRFSKNST